MNVAIWNINQPSQVVSNIIERFYNSFMKQNGREEFNVAAHIVMHRGGVEPLSLINDTAIIDLAQFKALYDKKVINGLILPREDFSGSTTVLPHLMRLNINLKDIYITRRLTSGEFAIEPYFSAKYLPYLEFHIADQCNLNCKACEHYSGLVKEPKFPDFDKFSKDMEQLHKFIDDIGVIRIMGASNS
ncbi:MAG: hypothetical protein IJ563_02715 [Selenomonadaceae bacterium]|nr:hypothetical protein [Selenomonadaceae bacterium]